MVSAFAIIIFFFILVLIYPAAAWILSVGGWWWKRRTRNKRGGGDGIEPEIDRKIDRLKDQAFTVSIILVFFFLTPVAVILWLL